MKAVVVGAGFGGLAAALRLRVRGYDVVVLEANDRAGGRAGVVERDGHVFDLGPTVITAPDLIDDLFALAGRDRRDYVELLPVDPFYRVLFPDGDRFDYVGDEERILAEIERVAPGDVDGYQKFAAHARRLYEAGYEGLAAQPFLRASDMWRAAPDLVKLRAVSSVYSLASRYFRDEKLRQVFTFQPLLIGGSPFRSPGLYAMIHWLERKGGVWFPRGGTGALVDALTTLLGELGVEVRTSARVEEIEVRDGVAVAVRLAGGARIVADCVVCNADPTTVYDRLVDARWRKKNDAARLERVQPSMGLFVSYFGSDGVYDDVAHHTIVLGPRYRGLLDDIFVRGVVADDFSLYLHRPTASDPSLAPAGRDTFYVLSPVPNLKVGANVDWSSLAPRYTERIHEALSSSVLPGLRTTTSFHIDPRTFRDRYASAHGAAFGPEPTLLQSAYFRFHNESEDVHSLYFVGAGTHPGAGVPGVLTSARILDAIVPAPADPRALPVPLRRSKSAA